MRSNARRLMALSGHLCRQQAPVAVADAGAESPAAAPPQTEATLVHMTEQQIYMFDLQGFIVLKGVVSPAIIRAANDAMDQMELRAPPIGTGAIVNDATVAGDLPPPCVLGDKRTEDNLYISNVMEGNLPAFTPFMDVPEVLGVVSDLSAGERYNSSSVSLCSLAHTLLHLLSMVSLQETTASTTHTPFRAGLAARPRYTELARR